MPEAWRLLSHTAHNGAWNMAVDDAILQSVAARISPPTLRLYGWDPACLSLGRAQPIEDIDDKQLSERGWGLVRRPTGGRAILHYHELTYAVIAPEDHPLMQGGVLESYRRISTALVRGLEHLAVTVEVKDSEPLSEEARANPICFEVPSAYEITVRGRKIIGSAQVRKRKTVLQHGSLPLAGDIGQICEVLNYQNDTQREMAKRKIAQQASTVEAVVRRRIPWVEAAEAIVLGFHRALDLSFTESELTQIEKTEVEQLIRTRYQNPAWTRRETKSASNDMMRS